MNGRELVLAAIRGEKTERVPWVPFCGVHCASLIGKTAEEYLKSGALMTAGLEAAIARYQPDGIPVIFDLQLEAEIFGCGLHWNRDNPPSVMTHPLQEGVSLDSLAPPTAGQGRIPEVVATIRALRAAHPELALYGLITGPFTLALHLLGTDIFMQMFDDPDAVQRLLAFGAKVGKAMSRIYLEAGCDVIAVVDPMTSQIGPEQFVEFCTEPLRGVFEHVRDCGGLGSLFVCGHAQKNIEVMADTHCDNISIDENIPLDYVRDICRARGISFGGNLQLTVVMLLGDERANQINAVQCLDVAGDAGGFILAPGCDIPFATPSANIAAVGAVARDPYVRDIARHLAAVPAELSIAKVDLSGHVVPDKLKIDIVTLDSLGCAPCQYMVAAARSAAERYGDAVAIAEHKIKVRDGLAMMAALGVRNIPTLCMDGEIVFVSAIPSHKALAEAIEERLRAKGLR